MTVYVVTTIVTILLAALNEHYINSRRKHKYLCRILNILIVFIPAFIAGVRDYTIGVDVYTYAYPLFTRAQSMNSFLDFMTSSTVEPGYKVLVYLTSVFFDDAHWLLFFTSLLTGLLFYISVYLVQDRCSITVAQIIYLLMFYPESLNIMRQYLAVGIALLGFVLLLKGKVKSSLLLTVLAVFFHRSAVLALAFYAIHMLYREGNSTKPRRTKKSKLPPQFITFVLTVVIFAVVLLFTRVMAVVYSLGLFPDSYAVYTASKNSGSYFKPTIFYIMPYVFYYARSKKVWPKNTMKIISIFDIALSLLRWQVFYLNRVAIYYCAVRILSLSQIKFDLSAIIRTKKIKKSDICCLGIIVGTIIYYIFNTVFWNNGYIWPYKSQIIGIK